MEPASGIRVAHLVPAPFDPEDGLIGGAERYSFELARHMADHVPTELISFGSRARSATVGNLRVRVLQARYVRGQRTNPVSRELWGALRGATIVHCHQQHVLASSMAALFTRLRRQRVFVTDLGGGNVEVLILATGNATLYDESGKAIARNPGQTWLLIVFDANGNEVSREVVKPSTGRSDDFCSAAVPALS